MNGFSKDLKIKLVTVVIVAMCVMNFSPMTAYASEGAVFEKAAMTVNGSEWDAIRYRGSEPFVLDLKFEGFEGELGNITVNLLFDKEGFGSITATGSAVEAYKNINANDNGSYYKADNLNSWYTGTYEITPREGAAALLIAFVPSNERALIDVDWHGTADGNLRVTLRPGSAASADYGVLPDFKYADEYTGIGSAGEFAVFANYFSAYNDYEGNIAVAQANLGGGGQFGVTNSCGERDYTGTYIGQMLNNDWSRIVKQVTGILVLGVDADGSQIYVTRDNGGEWFAWSENMSPRKFSANGDLTDVFLLEDMTDNPNLAGKVIDFAEAFRQLENLAAALAGKQTLGIVRAGDGSYAVTGDPNGNLDENSVADIVIEGNQITVICKDGINNIVSIAADVLADDRQTIRFRGENGSSNYSVIINVTDSAGMALSLDNPFVEIDGRMIDPGYENYAGRILLNFGTYSGAIRFGKTHAGAVLAPNASVTAGNTHNGSVIANEVYVDGEIHKNKFQWFDPTPTPAPTNTPTPLPTDTPTPTITPTPTAGPTPWTIPSTTPKVSMTPTPTEGANPTPEEEATPTPPEEEVTPTPPEEATPTPEEEVTPTPPEEATPTPEEEVTPPPPEGATPTPEEEVTPTPPEGATPTPEEEVTPTPPEGATPTPPEGATPTPEEEVTPTPPEGATPTPEEEVTPTPTEGATPTPEEEATPTPTEGATPMPEEEVTPTPPEGVTPPLEEEITPTPTPFYNIPTLTPTPTLTSTPTPTEAVTTTPTPTIWTPRIEPSITLIPTDVLTLTPGVTVTPEITSTPGPDPLDDTPIPDDPVPTPEMEEIIILEEENPYGIPDPSKPDEEITVIDPEELLEILDDIPLGIPVAEPEEDPEELEIEDETPEGLPKTGVAGTGLFVAVGMAMMSFGAAIGIGGRKKKDDSKKDK